jgi:hypothetical protein
MSSGVRRSGHLARHLANLRRQRGLKTAQLASALGATNACKVGSLIREFELRGTINDYLLKKLLAELRPDPEQLRRCFELDQAEALEQLERERAAWEIWADEPIEPFLTIRYMPAVYGVRAVPPQFCTPRENAEDIAWARERAEEWAAAELRRFRAKGFLNWSRRERTWFDQCGVNPDRSQVTFESRTTGAWMQVSGSQQRFLLGGGGELITRSHGLDHL